jgi:hypothetical protein
MTAASTILQLYSSDNTEKWIDSLRKEVDQVIGEDDGQWSKAGLGRLVKIDSAIREAMRFNPLSATILQRVASQHPTVKFNDLHQAFQVKDPSGFTFNDGMYVPPGLRITFPAWSIHQCVSSLPPLSRRVTLSVATKNCSQTPISTIHIDSQIL